MNKKENWYRYFWPWFIVTLLLSTVIACFVTLWISMQDPDVRVNASDKTWRGVVLEEHAE